VLVNSLVVTFISFSAMMGSMFLLPNFAQTYLGYSATKTGLLLLPMALTMMIVAPLSSRFLARFAPRVSITIGMTIAAVAMYLLHGLDARTTALELTFPMMLLALGLALGFAPLTAAATTSVPPRESGMASGILNLTRNVAGAMGIAVFGTLLDNTIESNVLDIGGATAVQSPAPSMGAMIPQLIVVKAEIEAYGHVFAAAALVMFVCAFVALTVREGPRRPGEVEAAEAASAA
jgi:MFS family permease